MNFIDRRNNLADFVIVARRTLVALLVHLAGSYRKHWQARFILTQRERMKSLEIKEFTIVGMETVLLGNESELMERS